MAIIIVYPLPHETGHAVGLGRLDFESCGQAAVRLAFVHTFAPEDTWASAALLPTGRVIITPVNTVHRVGELMPPHIQALLLDLPSFYVGE